MNNNNPVIGRDVRPDLSQHPRAFRCFKQPVPVKYSFATKKMTIETLEGPVVCSKGDVIMTGVAGERWPIPRDKFNATYDIVDESTATKKYIEVSAVKLIEEARVRVPWSKDLLTGNIGDYVVQYGVDSYGVVNNQVFEQTYAIL